MTAEAVFLEAVQAAPQDCALRLVYADWLEEQGDGTRSDLIRVEETMRGLAAYSDRFWQLKPVRNALRERAAAEWLEAMGYGVDCRPLFGHGLPDDWRGRWRLVREFVERWSRFPLGDVGGRPDVMAEAEERLGCALPPSVREWIAFAHDVRPLYSLDGTAGASPFFFLDRIYRLEHRIGAQTLCLMTDADADVYWGIRHADMASPDPPVTQRLTADDSIFRSRYRSLAALSAFVLRDLLDSTWGEGGHCWTRVMGAREWVRRLEAVFSSSIRLVGIAFFEQDNLAVKVHSCPPDREASVHVQAAKPLPRGAIPPLVWELATSSYASRGIFRQRAHELPAGSSSEEIPF